MLPKTKGECHTWSCRYHGWRGNSSHFLDLPVRVMKTSGTEEDRQTSGTPATSKEEMSTCRNPHHNLAKSRVDTKRWLLTLTSFSCSKSQKVDGKTDLLLPSKDNSIRPAICVIRGWCKTPTLPVTPAQLKRPGIGLNASCALSDCFASRP